jgi:hypothetical protein
MGFEASVGRIKFTGTTDDFQTWRDVPASSGRTNAAGVFIDMRVICVVAELPPYPWRSLDSVPSR